MEIYENEEEQLAALKAWWEENKRSVIMGAILGAILVLSWNYWQDYKKTQTEQASALYSQALDLVKTGNNDSAEKITKQIVKQYGSTAYSDYAVLMQAKIKVAKGDLEGAKKILEPMLKKGEPTMRNLARIQLVRLMLATKEYEKGLQLINEVDPASSKSFSSSYDELTGDLYVALDRLGEARTAYQNALREGQGSPLLQFKLDDITAPETVKTPAG